LCAAAKSLHLGSHTVRPVPGCDDLDVRLESYSLPMLSWLPAAIALWLALNLVVVLLGGAGRRHRDE
jgi:hypothetical protein